MEGITNQGLAAMSSLICLPDTAVHIILFIIENNRYSMHKHSEVVVIDYNAPYIIKSL